jgi:hypothetical protein
MGFVVCLGQLLAGCGQNTSDRLDFALPTLDFEFSSESTQWRQAPPTAVPNMVCAGPQALATDCCSPPAILSAVDCQQYPIACDPLSNFCALTFDMEVTKKVDLVADGTEVGAVDGRVFTRVSLLTLSTSVGDTDDLPIRGANLYIGPGDAGSSSSPAATLLAPVSLTLGTTLVAPSAEAQQAFSGLARDYRTPFSLWLAGHFVISNGSAPAGTVTFSVKARAEAVY